MPYIFASAFAALLLDQGSKATAWILAGQRTLSCGLFQIRYLPAVRPFFLRRNSRLAFFLLWLASLGCGLLLYRRGGWFQSGSAQVGLGLAFGSAAGNLLDVLRRHHVVDFVDFRCWPVFNLADLGIVAGLCLALWHY